MLPPRYARRIGTVAIGAEKLVTWMVIRTDEVSPNVVLARGFESVPIELTDAEVCDQYGVAEIITVTDRRLMET